jgi:1-acyl-sn-glycerol-3-phosphate acyltransferase
MKRFLDRLSYIRSLAITAPLIFLYTGIMGSISLASSLVDSSGKLQHSCARIWSRLILWTSGIRVKVEGLDHLQPNAPYILCANHQSHMDTPIMLAALPFQFRFAAKKELFRLPFLGWHLRRSGHVAIDRGNPHAAMKSLREATDKIRRGMPVVIFPEGGTSVDGRIKPFKRGGFLLATESLADVVPVTIRGSRKVLVPKTHHVRRGEVEVELGAPVSTVGASPSEIAVRVHDEIVARFEGA